MKTSPRGLPLFRSEGQARVLAEVFSAADGVSLSEIARRKHLSPSAVHHEVQRLEEAGLVRSDRVGRTRVVRPNESSPVFGEVNGLVMKAFGPSSVLGDELADVGGIRDAYIFGSWARRYEGEPGPVPRDVDVIVIGAPAYDDVYAACRQAEQRLAMEVNPVIVSGEDWDQAATPFVEQLKEGSLVPVRTADG